MFRKIFNASIVEKRPAYSIYLGFLFTLVSFLTSLIIFRNTPSFIGYATMVFTVALTIPILNKLFLLEEKKEIRLRRIFDRHQPLVDFFIYFFIGSFIVLFIISLISPGLVFSKANLLGLESDYSTTVIQSQQSLPAPPPLPGTQQTRLFSIFLNNFFVMIVAFALSFFYGAGSIFLISLNASIFASTLAFLVKIKAPQWGTVGLAAYLSCNMGVMFFHMIPELLAYITAAVAGGILAKGIFLEKLKSKAFKDLLFNSVFLLTVAIAILSAGALIETNLSHNLLTSNVCTSNPLPIIVIALIFLFIVGFLEIKRYKRSQKLASFEKKLEKKITK